MEKNIEDLKAYLSKVLALYVSSIKLCIYFLENEDLPPRILGLKTNQEKGGRKWKIS
jgi:hypothetical protein